MPVCGLGDGGMTRGETEKDFFAFSGAPLLITWRIGTMLLGEVT